MAYVERRKNDFRARWKRPDGSYDGLGGFLDYDVALEYGRDQETDVRRGDYYDRRDGDITLREWVPMWVEAVELDDTSEDTYLSRIRSQILPVWGDLTMVAISESPMKVRAWRKRLKASGLSANYVGDVFMVFGLLLDDAVEEGIIKTSPMPKPNRRRGKYTPPPARKEIYPTTFQALQLAENGRQLWHLTGYTFMLTKAFTGMRLGEMTGLRREYCYPLWPACEPDADARPEAIKRYGGMPAIRVQWQLPHASKVLRLKPPKYGSQRTLVLPPFLAGLLCDLLDSHDSEWVFPGMRGGSLFNTEFYKNYWDPIVDGAPERFGPRWARPGITPVDGMAGLVPHGLRHGHKTWLDEDGHSRVAVEARMGHVIDGVEGVYSHVTAEMERRVAMALQVRWARAALATGEQGLASPGILLDDLQAARERNSTPSDLRIRRASRRG